MFAGRTVIKGEILPGVQYLPPLGRSRAKSEGLAGTGAARGAGGRGGSAPSPRAILPCQSLAYARAGAVFRAVRRCVLTKDGRRSRGGVGGMDSGTLGSHPRALL